MTGPKLPPVDPSPELGLGGNSDLAFTGSRKDVSHPRREEEEADSASTTEVPPQSLEDARSSDLLFGELARAAQRRKADGPTSDTNEEGEEGPLLDT